MPVPLHELGGTRTDPVQLCAAQTIPAGSGEQVPPGMRLQATQAPLQALLQQTPSTQKPEAHRLASLQALPFGSPAVLTQLPI